MRLPALALAVTLLVPATTSAEAMDTVLVQLDRAQIMTLDQPAQTVILGNPAIADALVQDRSRLILTGKSFGSTNMIVLGQDGEMIDEYLLQVRSPDNGAVTVQKGAQRLSYSCAPVCERTLSIGDTPASYSELSGTIQSHIGLATGAAGE